MAAGIRWHSIVGRGGGGPHAGNIVLLKYRIAEIAIGISFMRIPHRGFT
jgi:hypothetical protein